MAYGSSKNATVSTRLQDLRAEVRKGLDQLDRGEGIPLDP
jgi:hypothetical protein